MSSRIKKLGVASLTALVAVAAFIIFSSKNESSGRNASAPSSDEHTAISAPGSPPEDVARLMDQEAVLNDKCRDGVGNADDKATQKVCEARDIILGEIKTKGWCWGHDGQIGADRNWEPCQHDNSAQQANAGPQATSQAPTPGAAQTDAQAKDASSNASASDITLNLNVIGNDQKPILNVKTNLPPKTILMATLVNPINQGGDGYVGQGSAAVQANQVVQFGPFSKTGGHLSPGTYQVTVTTVMAALQPEEFQQFFGVHGERLTGLQVSTLPGTSERLVSQRFQFKIDPL